LENLFKNLTLEYWYKMLILMSFVLLVVSLIFPIQMIPNGALALLSLGGFFIGTGEWINHPYQEAVTPSRRYKYVSYSRKNCTDGVITVIVGGAFAVAGVILAVMHGKFFP